MKIKVCGIVDVEQILALDELAIDYIGINFYPQSKRYFHGAKNLSNLCLKYAKLTGVFVDPALDTVFKAVDNHQLTYIQLHGNETPEFCNALVARGLKVVKVFDGNHISDYKTMLMYDACNFFIIDSGLSNLAGQGKKFDWTNLKYAGITKPWMPTPHCRNWVRIKLGRPLSRRQSRSGTPILLPPTRSSASSKR